MKASHEIRDAIHTFIQVNRSERAVIDSLPVQRLRHIHQLAMSYLVYPGATHRRFEHSLGVMHLAGDVFDVVTDQSNLTDAIRELIPEVNERENLSYWRTVVRLAALCHDLGHLPFSHAAEHELLPGGYTHERLSADLIMSEPFAQLLANLTPPITGQLLAKLAVGPKKSDERFSVWEAVLTELIVGDAFGVDRMDYLLRDSLHAGVQYGRFDHHRLISTMRLLPPAPTDAEQAERTIEPKLGIEDGGLQTAESLLLARYFMFSQVYYHPVRLMYDAHLQDFLAEWLPNGRFSVDVNDHLAMTDLEVLTAMRAAATDQQAPGHAAAKRVLERGHFRRVYDRTPDDQLLAGEPGKAIEKALAERYGAENVKRRRIAGGSGDREFPVRMHNGTVVSSLSLSDALRNMPKAAVDRVFIEPSLLEDALSWLKDNKQAALESFAAEGGQEG